MSTNISKLHREDLLDKIRQIRTYIASAQRDQNTGNLLQYLDELVKDVKGKKYGLVFEQHREAIDETLETHVPVLTEQPDLFIDNGGQMNFLIEGDNLASLQLLEKTHKGKIDVIYIDPPYNTGKKDDFTYDDKSIDENDTYIHSKWLSFIQTRLISARKLLSKRGVMAISIGYQEINDLMLLCNEIFDSRQVTNVTVQTSGGKPNGGFTLMHEYLVFITPKDFTPKAMTFTGGNSRSPFEGLTLSTFYKTNRPNQTYPIFIDRKTKHIVGVGKTLAERVKDGSYIGELADFNYDFDEAPEGTAALWPISNKGAECVWRLIPERLLSDWEKGYIKVSVNKSKNNPNEYSLQYLPEGVIQKIESGELLIIGKEDNMPTLLLGENKTEGNEIPTIWTEKEFHTVKGTTALKEIFKTNVFSYPKPLEFIIEIIKATTAKQCTILDFFAGSGTTGQAVMELNLQDGGKRRFILCTNNENNICRDVTYERLKTVITGKRKDGSEYSEKYPASLKYYKVEFVPITDKVYYEYADELLQHVRELVELENGINFTGNSEIAIVLTDDEMAQFVAQDDVQAKTLYRGHNVLLTAEQEAFISAHGIRVHVIPDYYYNEMTK